MKERERKRKRTTRETAGGGKKMENSKSVHVIDRPTRVFGGAGSEERRRFCVLRLCVRDAAGPSGPSRISPDRTLRPFFLLGPPRRARSGAWAAASPSSGAPSGEGRSFLRGDRLRRLPFTICAPYPAPCEVCRHTPLVKGLLRFFCSTVCAERERGEGTIHCGSASAAGKKRCYTSPDLASAMANALPLSASATAVFLCVWGSIVFVPFCPSVAACDAHFTPPPQTRLQCRSKLVPRVAGAV